MNIFKKLFCGHKWKTYSKNSYLLESDVKAAIKLGYKPAESHVEVLVCELCGCIKTIKY